MKVKALKATQPLATVKTTVCLLAALYICCKDTFGTSHIKICSISAKILGCTDSFDENVVNRYLRPHGNSYSTQATTRIYIILSLLIAESRYGRRSGNLRITKNANFAFLILIHFLIKACARIIVIFIFIFSVH